MYYIKQISLILMVCLFSIFSYGQSLREVRQEIKELQAPLQKSLNTLDKAHLSRSLRFSVGENKLLILNNQSLLRDIYLKMVGLRDFIFEFSKKMQVGNKKHQDELRLYVVDYQEKLVRSLAIFFNSHQKFGGFPTSMKEIRDLNIQLAKSSFVGIVDFVKMKARHLNDEKVEILLKEMEYLQIASSTYLGNMETTKRDYGHLVQFMATQQAIVNRGELSNMGSISESSISQCMPGNLYLSEQKNYLISNHKLNEESRETMFFSHYASVLQDKVFPTMAKKSYFSEKSVETLFDRIAEQPYGKKLVDKAQQIQVINAYAAALNQEIDSKERNGESFDMTALAAGFKVQDQSAPLGIFGNIDRSKSRIPYYEFDTKENQELRLSSYESFSRAQFSKVLREMLNKFWSSPELMRGVFTSFLNGDEIDLKKISERATLEAEKSFYLFFGNFLRSIAGDEKDKKMSFAVSFIQDGVALWKKDLELEIQKQIPHFSTALTSEMKGKKKSEFGKQELLKVYPYLKSLKLLQLFRKNAYENFPHKEKLAIIPDMPSDLDALVSPIYDPTWNICPQESDKILESFKLEVRDAFFYLAPFLEMLSGSPNDYFELKNQRVSFNSKEFDKKLFANLGEFFEKRKYDKVDLKYLPSIQREYSQILAFAKTGRKDVLSAHTKRYLSQRSQGKYGKKTAETLLKTLQQKKVFNSSTEPSISTIWKENEKLSQKRSNLLWNIIQWKVGEYMKGFNIKSLVNEKGEFAFLAYTPRNREEALAQSERMKKCEVVINKPGSPEHETTNIKVGESYSSDFGNISYYSTEKVALSSSLKKGEIPGVKTYERPKDLFSGSASFLAHKKDYKVIFVNLMRKMGMSPGKFSVANEKTPEKFNPSTSQIKSLAKGRVQELFATSSLLRTPYKLTKNAYAPTAERLLRHYRFEESIGNDFSLSSAQVTLNDTLNQAILNSQKFAEKWCGSPAYSGGGLDNGFQDIIRNAPLVRKQINSELQLLTIRKGDDLESFSQKMGELDKFFEKSSRTNGEIANEYLQYAAMALGGLFILALVLSGVGLLAGVSLGGAALMSIMGTHMAFIFLISFSSRMHHLYVRTPAVLNAQYSIASTQLTNALYSDWDALESKINENIHARTDSVEIAKHIGEGLLNGVFAFQIARIPYIRYSSAHMSKLLRLWGLPKIKALRPLAKAAAPRFKDLTSIKGIKKGFKFIGARFANNWQKIFKHERYMAGIFESHKAEFLAQGMKFRVGSLAKKHFSENELIQIAKMMKDKLNLPKKVKVNVTNMKEGVGGEFTAGLDEVIEVIARGEKSFDMNSFQKITSGFGDLGKSILKSIKSIPGSISKSIKYRRFRSQGFLRSWKAGERRLWNNQKLRAWRTRQDELKDAFKQMTENINGQKELVRKSMIQKIEQAQAYTFGIEGEVAAEASLHGILFGKGPGAFTQPEIMEFATFVMTNFKAGGMGTKYDFIKMLIAEYPVLLRRLKVDPSLSGFKMPEEMAKLLGVSGQFKNSENFKVLPYFKIKNRSIFNYLMDAAEQGITKRRFAIAVSLMGVGYIFKDEINYWFENFKTLWEQETGEAWSEMERLGNLEDLKEFKEILSSSDYLPEEEVEVIIKSLEENMRDLEKIESQVDNLREEDRDISDALDSIINNEVSEKEELRENLEYYKTLVDSLGVSGKFQDQFERIEELLEEMDD